MQEQFAADKIGFPEMHRSSRHRNRSLIFRDLVTAPPARLTYHSPSADVA